VPIIMTFPRLRLSASAVGVLILGACAGTPPPTTVKVLPAPGAPSPEAASAQLDRAEADLRAGRYDRALEGFSAVHRMNEANARARIGLAEAHLALGNPDMAIRIFDGWEAPAAYRATVAQDKGISWLLTGENDKARSLLTEAVGTDMGLWRAWTALAMLHDRSKDWDQADLCFKQASMANPRSGAVFNNHGMSLMLRGRVDDAIREFRQAIQIEPGLKTALDNLALATALEGRYEMAMAAVPSDKLPATMNNAGFAALSRGDLVRAEDLFTQAVKSSPRHFSQAEENLRWLHYIKSNADPSS
jgi:Tfp pilus assembly protein PilF